MCDIRYFKAARHNYIVAVKLRQFYQSDEAMVNDIAYNLQQCVEKTLKAFLECVGVTVPNTNSISKLVAMCKNNGSLVKITEWIDDRAYMLETWESETRYNFDFLIEIGKIDQAIDEIGHFLEVNGLSNHLLDGVDEDVKNQIRNYLPENVEPEDELEWNCYYLVLLKRKRI